MASGHLFCTQRFVFFVGWHCWRMMIKDVDEETALVWKMIKNLDAQYLFEQLRRAGTSAPEVVGIDEISIRRGRT